MNTGDSLQKKNNLTGWAFVLLAVVGIVAFYFYPMIQALLLSFKSGVGANLEFSGLSNYKRLLVDTTFRTALSNTFIYLIIQVPVMIILGLFISVLLNDS
ncbi:carbohydrate ABC transporter permease, partial [Paenibacillus sp.]